mgnify:FL=1
MWSEGPTYQYTIVTDPLMVIQFDWKLYQRDGVEIGADTRELPLPKAWHGRAVANVRLQDLQYLARPR